MNYGLDDLYGGVVKVEKSIKRGVFGFEIMSLMFIQQPLGIIESWNQLHRIIIAQYPSWNYYNICSDCFGKSNASSLRKKTPRW